VYILSALSQRKSENPNKRGFACNCCLPGSLKDFAFCSPCVDGFNNICWREKETLCCKNVLLLFGSMPEGSELKDEAGMGEVEGNNNLMEGGGGETMDEMGGGGGVAGGNRAGGGGGTGAIAEQIDVESYASLYTGHTKVARLHFIADYCNVRSVELEALRMAFEEIKKGENTALFKECVEKINGRLGPSHTLDQEWIDMVERRAAQRQEKLETELNGYKVPPSLPKTLNHVIFSCICAVDIASVVLFQSFSVGIEVCNRRFWQFILFSKFANGESFFVQRSLLTHCVAKLEIEVRSSWSDIRVYYVVQTNLIKESIRMGYNDLGDFHYGRGDLQHAFKCYVRTRDYCTTSKHIISMCLNVILVSIELGHFVHVCNYVSKADQTPDVQDPVVVAKLKCAAGLAYLESKKYKLAARKVQPLSLPHHGFTEIR